MLEKLFERGLWSTRLMTLSAVIFSILAAFVLFFLASADLYHAAVSTYQYFFMGIHPADFHADLVAEIIGAVDLYLIALVLLIFGFGIYELFISDIDVAKDIGGDKVLYVSSLDELKDKIAKVIVMVLIVNFFQRVLHTDYKGALEMLYFAFSILALSLGLYFLHKGGKH
ncbi:YqhA family protein [Sulfurospirillum multivorans]|uniref:Membrane protein n=2 Tax=Sulfurospirillum multivorans TaxID=66821 RepID=A0AA86AJP4_SULMK|nr:YqhA family protein [Sulfurospirillum multivorans]AHJ11684.1 membrane protein [Sulfurospirillum multivorans DSM 12446]QEH05184.1 membrane protein [Sulfurospirillum multivorans]